MSYHAFKIGDRVKRTCESWRDVVKGEVYTVSGFRPSMLDTYDNIVLVGLNGEYSYDQDLFELVSSKTNKVFIKPSCTFKEYIQSELLNAK